ncbi:MAG TPA: hypothetical protein VFN67_29890 [Polyangiales bacterium]|nr:hypothetical protein [Polyangiales bacterium]
MSNEIYLNNTRPSKVVLARPSPGNPFDHVTIELLPGLNGPFPGDEIAAMRANPITDKVYFASKIIVVGEPDLTPVADVLVEIAECTNVDTLKLWMTTRAHNDEVRAALCARADEIRPARDRAEQREYDAQMQKAEYL